MKETNDYRLKGPDKCIRIWFVRRWKNRSSKLFHLCDSMQFHFVWIRIHFFCKIRGIRIELNSRNQSTVQTNVYQGLSFSTIKIIDSAVSMGSCPTTNRRAGYLYKLRDSNKITFSTTISVIEKSRLTIRLPFQWEIESFWLSWNRCIELIHISISNELFSSSSLAPNFVWNAFNTSRCDHCLSPHCDSNLKRFQFKWTVRIKGTELWNSLSSSMSLFCVSKSKHIFRSKSTMSFSARNNFAFCIAAPIGSQSFCVNVPTLWNGQ